MHQHRPVPGEFRLVPPDRPLRQDRLQEGPAGPLAGFREPSVRTPQRTGRHGVRPGSYVKGTGCGDAAPNGLESRSRRAQPARATSRQGPLARRWPSHAAWRRRTGVGGLPCSRSRPWSVAVRAQGGHVPWHVGPALGQVFDVVGPAGSAGRRRLPGRAPRPQFPSGTGVFWHPMGLRDLATVGPGPTGAILRLAHSD